MNLLKGLTLKTLSVRFPKTGSALGADSGAAVANESAPVRDVSLHIGPGEALALVGESGSGKSLTALSIMGLLPENARLHGEVLWNGVAVRSLDRRDWAGRKVAMIFQDPVASLNPSYTIGDQLTECLRLRSPSSAGLNRKELLTRAVQLLEEVGINEPTARMKSYPHELSGGMNQRIGIALALACEPDLLIADEPTTALDVTVQKQILDLLKRLMLSRKMSVLLITHDLAVAGLLCERIAVMYAGELVEVGTRDAVLYRGLHPYTDALLRARPGKASVSLKGTDSSKTSDRSIDREVRLASIPGTVPRADDFQAGCRFQDRCARVEAKCRAQAVPFEEVGVRDAPAKDKKNETQSKHWIRCYYPVVTTDKPMPSQSRSPVAGSES